MARSGTLPTGKEIELFNNVESGAGSRSESFTIDAESVIVTLYVSSVSGTLDVTVHTIGAPGQEIEIIAFPTISAPTSEILLRKSASSLQKLRVTVTFSDACTYNIRARGASAGAASVKVEGATSFSVTQTTVATVADVLLPASLTDRSGLMIINHSTTNTIYIAETLAKATSSAGAPIYPNGGNMSLDLGAGAELYAIATGGTADIRIVQAGGS